MDAPEFLTRAEAAAWFKARGFPCGTSQLAKRAMTGDGPRLHYVGARIPRYRESDLREWMLSRISPAQSTSELPRPAGAKRRGRPPSSSAAA